MAQSTGINTLCDSHSVTAPSAGQAICTITPNVAAGRSGYFNVTIATQQTGTADGQNANMQLVVTGYQGGPDVLGGLLSAPTISYIGQNARVCVPAGGTIQVQAINAAGAGAIYNASLSATRTNSTGGAPW